MEHTNPNREAIEPRSGRIQAEAPHSIASDCIDAWRTEAEEHSAKGIAAEAVCTLRRCADELAAAIRADAERLVSLRDASSICGYSTDHLGVLLRNGTLVNYGRCGAPRLCVSELPRKAGRLTPVYADANVRRQIVREIAHSIRSSDAQA